MAALGTFTLGATQTGTSPSRVLTLGGYEVEVIDNTDYYPEAIITVPSSHNLIVE